MTHSPVDHLISQLKSGDLTRRGFVQRASALGLSAAAATILARNAVAQESTPAASPVTGTGTGEVINSITFEEYKAAFRQEFPFEEPQVTGGRIIHVHPDDIQGLNPHVVNDTLSEYITDQVFENLVAYSAIDGTPAPRLASS